MVGVSVNRFLKNFVINFIFSYEASWGWKSFAKFFQRGGRIFQNESSCQRFVFITGDVISERVQQFLKERQKKCLLKPFSLAEFRGAVEEALSDK